MKLPLRLRFSIYAMAGIVYLAGLVVAVMFVASPALLRVERALTPIQSVFLSIADRQRRVLREIDLLDRLLALPAAPKAHASLQSLEGDRPPAASLLSIYGPVLPPAAAKKLAVAEDELGAIESAFGEAVALYQLGDRATAGRKLAGIRRAEDRSQEHYNEAMVLALTAGADARRAFQQTTETLLLIAGAWILLGALLVLVIAYDANRHIWLPIRALEAGVRRIAAGDWSRPVAFEPGDELGELAAQFNALTETLQRGAGQHAQLATAGELLAGVAHELNNPLQAIRGTAELKAAGESSSRDWSTVLAQAERASKLARDLVQFVRPSTRDVRLVSLNEVVRNGVNLIEFQYRADGIGLQLDLGDDLPAVQSDPHELAQVIVNLLGNAHGVLKQTAGPKRVFVRTWAESGRVYCRILDTGPGIGPEARERIFSPFYSTREIGVGLGLTVSRSLVRGAGGDLMLDGGAPGASFTFWLPGVESPLPAPPPPPIVTRPSRRAATTSAKSFENVRILIADDEDAIRNVLERFFTRDGATVIVAHGGSEALDVIRRNSIDVVVLDLRMPDLNGADVYRTVQEERPELAARIIFLSGDVTRVTDELDVPRERVLVKPVELGELKRAVMEVVRSLPGSL